MAVTMREIDAFREEAHDWLHRFRSAQEEVAVGHRTDDDAVRYARLRLEEARGMVERYLREWWAQGCREVEAAPEAPALPALNPGYSRELSYTVQPGDTLSDIAHRTGVFARAPGCRSKSAWGGAHLLAWLNRIPVAGHIEPGWRLILPTLADHEAWEKRTPPFVPAAQRIPKPADAKKVPLRLPPESEHRGPRRIQYACEACHDLVGSYMPPAGTRCGCGNETFVRALVPIEHST